LHKTRIEEEVELIEGVREEGGYCSERPAIKEIEVPPPPNTLRSHDSYLAGWRGGWQADAEAMLGRVLKASWGPCKGSSVMSKTHSSHLQCI
jgi:hypothetical protein